MDELEIIYEIVSGKIKTTKIAGVDDTVVPDGFGIKKIPYFVGMRKDLDKMLFDGEKFVSNPGYIYLKSNKEKIQQSETLVELKDVLMDIL